MVSDVRFGKTKEKKFHVKIRVIVKESLIVGCTKSIFSARAVYFLTVP